MPFTVNIQFGGLCLFVEQEDSALPEEQRERGLFVLMPEMKEHGMVHSPYLVYDGVHDGARGVAGDAQVHQIEGRIAKLRGPHQDVHGGDLGNAGMQGLPGDLAPVSHFGGQAHGGARPVEKRFTRGPLFWGLACRVELELGLAVIPCGAGANLTIDGPNGRDFTAVGRATVSFQVSDNPHLDVAGWRLVPDGNDVLNIGLHNVPKGTVLDPERKPHRMGQRVPHFHAYYKLVGLPHGPIPKSADDGEAPPPSDVIPAGPCEHLFFIDPYRCTIGGGCEDETC